MRSLTRLVALSALVATLVSSNPQVRAATATANLSVTATVADRCTIDTSPLAFGSYDPVTTHASANLDASGQVTVTCTMGAAAVITLDQGANPQGGSSDAAPLRRLKSGASYLAYSIYANAGRTTTWGNTPQTGVAHTGTGASTNLTVYGRIGAAQNVAAGTYGDTVLATVTF